MNENRDIEDALRASLERHARQAPPGDLVAERVILRAGEPHPATRPWVRWRTWALPVLASASVAAVVIGIAATSGPGNHTAIKVGNRTPPVSTSVSSPTTSSHPVKTFGVPAGTSVPGAPGFEVTDLTFVSTTEGWALGTARCLTGSGGRCTAMLHTKDGVHWTSMAGPAADVIGSCMGTDPCISHIRFADSKTGYAFGTSAFFLTTNGGAHWTQLAGGADALETLDLNVIRVTSSGSGCPGPCHVGVETSANGSTSFTPEALPTLPDFVGSLSFERGNGGYAYLLVKRSPAGGASNETSTLYRSTNSGRTWESAGEPCPPFLGQHGNLEADSIDVAGGGGGRVAVLCLERGSQSQQRFVATSTDGGAHFTFANGKLYGAPTMLVGDPATVLAAGGPNGLALSTDGGVTWNQAADVTGSVSFLGFESKSVGRCVTNHGRTIWTTNDGGRIWSSITFS